MAIKLKAIIVLTFVLSLSLILIPASFQISPSQENGDTTEDSPSGVYSDGSRNVNVSLSQSGNLSETIFTITQGESIQINIALTSFSKTSDFTIPLYLSVGSYENNKFSKLLTAPPVPPYPTFPWPGYNNSHELSAPFEANFSNNPLTLNPEESKTVILTISALENTQAGQYTMYVAMGNSEQTGLGGATFHLLVEQKR